ncbi:hypothetical protein Q4575_13545 [Psychrosphaera sp. 1_MG-2023]|uniref:hypothetical protein n=1 Tax=Psychrosphaera sp. 1_MG-2023 TaxID=3062643 RepID=UPI0026E13984|nr:hypothetical protein [Psychrosphaera sp. 1_MG-2023]MDO6720437.1 hypothetical protein [Psychrosphaera sp. 1_MG-2023]
MNIKTTLITILFASLSTTAFAKGPSENGSAASKHSVLAVGHATASGAQVASAVVAVPLLAVGSVGSVALAAGESLMDNVSAAKPQAVDRTKPLEITEITITVERNPAERIKQQ